MPLAQISLDALRHNLGRVRSHIAPTTQVLAAVKANGYGHGAVAVAKQLQAEGVSWLGVATAAEALELRSGGVDANILVFSPVYERLDELVAHDVALTLSDISNLEVLEPYEGARVHLKVDTGMGRLGLPWQDAVDLARAVDASKSVTLEGVWTHFACSDDEDRGSTRCQLEAFHLFLAKLEQDRIHPGIVHAANSAAVFAYSEAQFDMVRPGIALYGYHSSTFIAGLEPGLKPVMTLTAPVTFVKRVRAGTPVSYSAMWAAPEDTSVATVRIGYADGYPRLLTNKAEVVVQGQLRPVAGRVCMDQLMVDVGDLDVKVGERLTLFGPGPLTAEVLAARIGTISYELLVSVGTRVARQYR